MGLKSTINNNGWIDRISGWPYKICWKFALAHIYWNHIFDRILNPSDFPRLEFSMLLLTILVKTRKKIMSFGFWKKANLQSPSFGHRAHRVWIFFLPRFAQLRCLWSCSWSNLPLSCGLDQKLPPSKVLVKSQWSFFPIVQTPNPHDFGWGNQVVAVLLRVVLWSIASTTAGTVGLSKLRYQAWASGVVHLGSRWCSTGKSVEKGVLEGGRAAELYECTTWFSNFCVVVYCKGQSCMLACDNACVLCMSFFNVFQIYSIFSTWIKLHRRILGVCFRITYRCPKEESTRFLPKWIISRGCGGPLVLNHGRVS